MSTASTPGVRGVEPKTLYRTAKRVCFSSPATAEWMSIFNVPFVAASQLALARAYLSACDNIISETKTVVTSNAGDLTFPFSPTVLPQELSLLSSLKWLEVR